MVTLVSGYCCRGSIISKMPSPKVTIKSHVIKQYFFIIASNFGKQMITLIRTSHRLLSYPTLQSFFFFALKKTFFYWRAAAFRCCVSAVQQSQSGVCVCVRARMCTYVYCFLVSFPFRSPKSTEWSSLPCAVWKALINYLSYTQQYIYVNPDLPTYPTTPSHYGIEKLVLYICVSISAFQISASVPLFQIPYISDIQHQFF